jgi:RNA polymerase sigma-70 factor (sigma-E family)
VIATLAPTERSAPIGSQPDSSFDEFVSLRSPRLLRSAYLLTGDRAEAEDLLQVALVRTARRWETAREAPAAYAHRVLLNLVRDRHRRRGRRVIEEPLGEDVLLGAAGDHVEAAVERDALIGALRQLPARQREVLVLRFYADLSVEETAAAIGASAGSVKTHTSRGLATLRAVLTAIDDTSEVHRAH